MILFHDFDLPLRTIFEAMLLMRTIGSSHGRDCPMRLQSRKFRVGSSRGSSRDAVFRKSSSSIPRSGAPKVLENTSKLEFSSCFIVYRLQLVHRGCTDESISENFEF